eukprot:TRINITY_DN10446_c0_g1_i30.p1 TRINITY_DN10446_c0_g1~~TRINITY_DN10446_c0_g1_i30.p1  ORF type:complete len:130 (+),score=12.86 TRINITY_DN10446_c0_g1_i30:62-451(+)
MKQWYQRRVREEKKLTQMKRQYSTIQQSIQNGNNMNHDQFKLYLSIEYEITAPWYALYIQYKKVTCSPCEDDRQFRAWLGVVLETAEMIWIKYDEGSSNFHLSCPTYRKYLWKTLYYLNDVMNEIYIIF